MTGYELYITALDLLGLRENEYNLPSDTADLKAKALSVINIILAENSELDCRIKKVEHSVTTISSLDDRIDMSDVLLYSVLPYGVARLMSLGEDDQLSAELNRLYSEAKAKAIRFGKAKIQPITEVYR